MIPDGAMIFFTEIIWLKLVVIQSVMVKVEVLPLSRISRANPKGTEPHVKRVSGINKCNKR